jgi:hypothetical protein
MSKARNQEMAARTVMETISYMFNDIDPETKIIIMEVCTLFREWKMLSEKSMHPNYKFAEGREHLTWLLGVNYRKNTNLLKKLLGPHGYTIYKALVAIRDHEG